MIEDVVELEALHNKKQRPIIKNQESTALNDEEIESENEGSSIIKTFAGEKGHQVQFLNHLGIEESGAAAVRDSSPKLTIVRRLRAIIFQWIPSRCSSSSSIEEDMNKKTCSSSFSNRRVQLEQTACEKLILYFNLAIILMGAIVLYVYFSINPFTSQEIAALRSNLNVTIVEVQ